MGRNRVMSFMSQFRDRDSKSPTRQPPSTGRARSRTESYTQAGSQDTGKSSSGKEPFPTSSFQMPSHQESPSSEVRASTQPTRTRERASSRPISMAQTFQPPLMDVNQDTLPELQPIFTFLNSHSNKLYQEGYFLKLDDQNIHGKANADRTWTECFAQLVGTILSLWDAAELDAAGQDGEVLPKFINLTDASIKMIESLPTRSPTEAPLQNVLSISTAGKNRYLLHFNSHHSLVQWTAGIRLCMYEHATLQEAYTGALIAGKGKLLNNIKPIMERSRVQTADWARVRFGAGTPWRRCWCVITPPDEKEVQRLQKQSQKKRSAYDRSRPPILKGDIKFYDSKRTKKVRPIATINDSYSAFAIYPQSKPLIDASTLVKVEGSITIHSNPPLTSEGFVFVMPEVHPAVSGFEMMLRWLFPVYDTFGLYGRPGRLIAETNDTRSLMFAMPEHRRYGYLETLDVSGLISEQGSANWLESEWRGRMKDLTAKRMVTLRNNSQRNSQYGSRRSRNSAGNPRTRLQFDDAASVRSSPSIQFGARPSGDVGYSGLPRTDSAPVSAVAFQQPKNSGLPHQRSISESQPPSRDQNQNPSVFDGAYEPASIPPLHIGSGLKYAQDGTPSPDRLSSEDEQAANATPVRELQELQTVTIPEPVAAPPAFRHAPGAKPPSKPLQSPDLRKANNRMSTATLSQLTGAAGAAASYQSQERRGLNAQTHDRIEEDEDQGRGVLSDVTRNHHMPANHDIINEGIVATYEPRNEQESALSSNRDQIPYQNQHYQSNNTNFNSRSQPNLSNDMLPPKNPSSQPSHLQTSQSISRKPLPTQQENQSSPNSSHPPSSSGSLTQHILDSGAFDLILPKAEDFKLPQMNRHNSDLSSAYDDAASTGTPDYASTKKSVRSVRTQESVEKPRAGRKKIIGNVEVGQPLYGDENTLSKGVDIDFGPTFDLNRAPGQDSPSPPPKQNNFNQSSSEKRPNHERSPSGNALAWQPGMSATAANNTFGHKQGLTAEEYVQQRSMVAAATPQYIHQRQPSGNILRAPSPTPARATPSPTPGRYTPSPTPGQTSKRSSALLAQHSRHSSADLLNFNEGHGQNRHSHRSSTDLLNSAEVYGQQQHARHSSADLLRPSSRGANRVLGPSGNGAVTTTLSAREQAFVAKMTGGPLIAMVKNNNKDNVVSAGLVGAIDSREKERQQVKQGFKSQSVQHAIALRQQQFAQQQQQQQAEQRRLDHQIAEQNRLLQQAEQRRFEQQIAEQNRLLQQAEQRRLDQQIAEQNRLLQQTEQRRLEQIAEQNRLLQQTEQNRRQSQYANTNYSPSQFAVPSKRGSWMGPNFPQTGAWTTPGQSPGQYQTTLAHSPGQYQTTLAHSPGQYQPTLAHSPGQYQPTLAHSPGYQASPHQYSQQQQYFPQYPPTQGGQRNSGYYG
ncbi:hypothetical protein BCIN_01g09780 [Botrytis cinerea B05.10]|uniref:PH domain-containing protein n=1 Tax=Botryotinia fuckeliana (strain B05.10) TaxID=332648 RepID=A0A384J756_BOTFB|nr:hypothetical protein BCIN_01g09780 [Botrytis cinerea B05.10]ATZ46369.1 hypothetical protein BCIN_01g09780 [Botrytis cinerea B05.10]